MQFYGIMERMTVMEKTIRPIVKNCYFVTASGLSSNPDGIHINAASQRTFGVRYYEAFSKQENLLPPMENEMELLNLCINRPYTKNEKKYLEMTKFASGQITYEEFVKNL